MDIIQGITSLGGFLTNGTIMAGLGTVTLGFLVWRRTRSLHPLMSRLWSLFSDRKECDNSKIDSFLKDRSALMQFRFTTGIQAPTSHQALAIIDYATEKNVDSDLIAACGEYFDLSVPELKSEKHLPKGWQLFLIISAFIIFGMTTLFSLFGSLSDNLIVRLHGSTTWFALDVHRAKPLLSSTALNFDQCATDHLYLAHQTGFTRNAIDILCTEKPEAIASYIKAGLPEQRFAFAYFMVVFFFLALSFLIWSYRGLNARQLNTLLKKAEKSNPLNESADVHASDTVNIATPETAV